VKIRIGFGLGTRSLTNDSERFEALVDGLERHHFDSLWLSERITGECPDPIVGMAYAAARTTKLKFGTSVLVLPGRNPMLLAKELATLDRLSGGRLLPAFGLGVVDPGEQQAFGVERKERAAIFDEVIPLLRRFWTEDVVDHDGPRYHYEAAKVRPFPVQRPIDVWLGGVAPSELRRTGRLGDGWLPSFCTPDDVRNGIPVIREHADAAGREIEEEHYGALLILADGEIPDLLAAAVAARRPGVDPAEIVAVDTKALRDKVEAFVEAGASKFVVVPLAEPPDWDPYLEELAEVVLPLQT
jgi:probable F420-dependent oxidoreductase